MMTTLETLVEFLENVAKFGLVECEDAFDGARRTRLTPTHKFLARNEKSGYNSGEVNTHSKR
jgi:hypothetical protein